MVLTGLCGVVGANSEVRIKKFLFDCLIVVEIRSGQRRINADLPGLGRPSASDQRTLAWPGVARSQEWCVAQIERLATGEESSQGRR